MTPVLSHSHAVCQSHPAVAPLLTLPGPKDFQKPPMDHFEQLPLALPPKCSPTPCWPLRFPWCSSARMSPTDWKMQRLERLAMPTGRFEPIGELFKLFKSNFFELKFTRFIKRRNFASICAVHHRDCGWWARWPRVVLEGAVESRLRRCGWARVGLLLENFIQSQREQIIQGALINF